MSSRWSSALCSAPASSPQRVLAWFFAGDAPAPIDRGSPAPAFELPRVGGGAPVSLASLRGKVVLLNFWATWCKPCEDELPAMERLRIDRSPAAISSSWASRSTRTPRPCCCSATASDSASRCCSTADQRVARSYETFRYPESLLIGRDGVILERYVGSKEWDSPAYVESIRRVIAACLRHQGLTSRALASARRTVSSARRRGGGNP